MSEVIHNDLINTTTCFLARKLYKSIIQYKHVVKKPIIMHVCRATVLPRKICNAIKKIVLLYCKAGIKDRLINTHVGTSTYIYYMDY